MRPPKILFLVRDLEVGGAQRQLVELASGLHRCGWTVVVATFYGGGVFEADLQAAGVTLVDLAKRSRWDVASFLGRLVRLIRRERPDIVHGYLDTPNMLLALLRPLLGRAPVVWGLASSAADMSRYDWLYRVEFRLGVAFSRFADLIISNSHAGVEYHGAHGYPRNRMIVIAQGIDLDRFRPDEAARDEIRREWNIGPGEKLIGVVARLDPMKDHATLLRAAAEVTGRRPATRFACVGDGPAGYRDDLRRLAHELGLEKHVLWVGERTDMPRVYNAFDVAVSSSAFGEGLSNAIAEAMATGVPCVVTDVGDSGALVAETGWVCPPGNSAMLARSILAALETPRCAAAAVRQRISTHYSAHGQLERAAAVLSRLLDVSSAQPHPPTIDPRRQ